MKDFFVRMKDWHIGDKIGFSILVVGFSFLAAFVIIDIIKAALL